MALIQDVVKNFPSNNIFVPVTGLGLFAVASGYLMSLIPLSLLDVGLSQTLTPWLASIFYLGLLLGANFIEPVVAKIGHRLSFIGFLLLLLFTVLAMYMMPNNIVWLVARFIAGMAIAGIFVVVESWLLIADTPKQRAKRLGFYMTALYGGGAIGQLGVSHIGVSGLVPYLVICGLILLAVLPPLLIKSGQPNFHCQQKIAFKEIKSISRPAIMGCLVSGLTLGPIYGLLPVYIKNQTGNDEHTGLMMALVVLGGMIVQPIVSYLSPRMSKSLLMAFFCLLGIGSVFTLLVTKFAVVIAMAYMMLGISVFALYPIAISLACETLHKDKIVAATQIMLLSYSIGSVLGPLVAMRFNAYQNNLLIYLGLCLLSTAIYMLMKAVRAPKDQQPLITP